MDLMQCFILYVLPQQADKFLSLLQLQDYVYQQWLSSNLGESGVPTLPVSKQAESYSHIETETILQVKIHKWEDHYLFILI